MDQLRDYADKRLLALAGCVYCGDTAATREHVPSRVFLDSPLPENLPVVGACEKCNNGFSSDEEYVACLIESAIAGSTDSDHMRRTNIARILRRSPALRARLEAAKAYINGQTHFFVEAERIRNIVIKLARGHAVYELSQLCRHDPVSVWWKPLALMDDQQRDEFDAAQIVETFGELGSRSIQRIFVVQAALQSANGQATTRTLVVNDWIEVQQDRYRYHAIDHGDVITIKIVFGEYLGCEVAWSTCK